MHRMKKSETEQIKKDLLKIQVYQCVLCTGSLKAGSIKKPVLDHDHDKGHIRGVLCNNCNGCEGKIKNLSRRAKGKFTRTEWLERLLEYWKTHEEPKYQILHHTFKTPEELRIEKNRKARAKRAAAKL